MADHPRARLVRDALATALWRRRPDDVVRRSDQGAPPYTPLAFGARCRGAGVRPSMGSVGDAYDDAPCESSFATLGCGPLDRRRFRPQAAARAAYLRHRAVLRLIEGWYKPRRRHSAPGDLAPVEYDRRAQAEA